MNERTLLCKLHRYRVRGKASDWLGSYLTSRVQCVWYKGLHSKLCDDTCGVLQGFIINDLPDEVIYSKSIIFAVDTDLLSSSGNVQSFQWKMQKLSCELFRSSLKQISNPQISRIVSIYDRISNIFTNEHLLTPPLTDRHGNNLY